MFLVTVAFVEQQVRDGERSAERVLCDEIQSNLESFPGIIAVTVDRQKSEAI
jgi:hypothetical protein